MYLNPVFLFVRKILYLSGLHWEDFEDAAYFFIAVHSLTRHKKCAIVQI